MVKTTDLDTYLDTYYKDNNITSNPYRQLSENLNYHHHCKPYNGGYNFYIEFHGYTTHEQNEELKNWLKINTTKHYFLCRNRVYFEEEADMGWFLLRWPPG